MPSENPAPAICFNLQNYSVHDGSGIRTTIFFKGCPLRCAWCCNPESWSFDPQLGFNEDKCIGCGECLKHQRNASLKPGPNGKMIFSHARSRLEAPELAERCLGGALVNYGKAYHVNDIIEKVVRESIFFSFSGGGITLSGGEPMAQPEFVRNLLLAAWKKRINTAMETCGHYEIEDRIDIFGLLRELFFDIKILDSSLHKQFTGKDNARILRNIKEIRERWPALKITIRTPVIPGVNDNPRAIGEIARFVRDNVPNARYELMKFHRFGEVKYRNLGMSYRYADDDLAQERYDSLKKIASAFVPPPAARDDSCLF